MRIEQTLSDEDYRQGFASLYSSYSRWTRFRPIGGLCLIGLGIISYATDPGMWGFLVIVSLYGVYMMTAKWIYIARLMRATRTAKRFGKPAVIEFPGDGKIKMDNEIGHTEMDMAGLYGYRITPPGVLLYWQRNMIYPLKRNAIEQAGGMETLTGLLDSAGVKRLG